MATINMGNFGQQVARPGPRVNVPQNDQLLQAATNLAGTGAQIATDMQAQETRLQLEAKQAADRAATISTLAKTKDALADLHDEIGQGVLDGTVAKQDAEAEFAKRSGKVLENVGADLPPEQRAIVQAELSSDASRYGNGIRKAVTQRNRQDVTASISSALEFFQRQYRDDPTGSTERAMGLLDSLGPQSSMTPDQIAKVRQGWKENTQYTAAFEQISKARTDRKGLDGAEKFIGTLPDLDPQKRAQLGDRIAAYRLHLDQQDEVRARRAEVAAQAHMRKAEAAFNTFQTLADKGTMLAPVYIDQAIEATAGTPYQAGIRALAQQARDSGGLAAQPVRSVELELQRIDAQIAQSGRTPALDKRREQIEKVLRGQKSDIQSGAMEAALQRGVITGLVPLDFKGGLPSVIDQIKARAPLAQQVSVWAGKNVSPVTETEAGMIQTQLQQLPAKERAGAIAGMAMVLGPAASQGLAEQLNPKDKALGLAFAMAGDRTTQGRYTSELVLKGAQAKQDGTSTKGQKQPEIKASQWSAAISAELEGVFQNQQTTDQVREAAVLIAHGIASEQGGELSQKDLQRAARLAVGGSIVDHNGRRIPLPAGIDQDALGKRLRSVTQADIAAPDGKVLAAGRPMSVADFLSTLPGQQLMPYRPGEFAVIVGGRPVLNTQGRVVTVKVQ